MGWTRHDSIYLCASVGLLCYLWKLPDPREATVGQVADKRAGMGSRGDERSSCSGQAALWRMAVVLCPHSFSRVRSDWVLFF